MLTDGDEHLRHVDPAVGVGLGAQRLHQPREQADVGVGPLLVRVLRVAACDGLGVEQVQLMHVPQELHACGVADAADGQCLEHGVVLLVARRIRSGETLDQVRPRAAVRERHGLVVRRQLLAAVRCRTQERFGQRAELGKHVLPVGRHDGELGCSPLAARPQAGEPVVVVHHPVVVEEPRPHGGRQRHRIRAEFRRVARRSDQRGLGHHLVANPALRDDGEQASLRGRRHVGCLIDVDESLAAASLRHPRCRHHVDDARLVVWRGIAGEIFGQVGGAEQGDEVPAQCCGQCLPRRRLADARVAACHDGGAGLEGEVQGRVAKTIGGHDRYS